MYVRTLSMLFDNGKSFLVTHSPFNWIKECKKWVQITLTEIAFNYSVKQLL